MTRLFLELDRTDPQISGRLSAAGADGRPFNGWLGLISALEAEVARLNGGQDPAARSSADRSGGKDEEG
jgi:hypothetical protein